MRKDCLVPKLITVGGVLRRIEVAASERIRFFFADQQLDYPPKRMAFLIFKHERILELWVDAENGWKRVHTYPVLGASGGPGPKLKEGDMQVPEGIYKITWLNPNSSYHLSMEINYPNSFDREKARLDGRMKLGREIFIHGKDVSEGCIAIGDTAIEELFVLAARVGIENINVIISPNDIRCEKPLVGNDNKILWLDELYENIKEELSGFLPVK